MRHTVSGRNFHGPYRIRLNGPAEGFVLTDRQAERYLHELCPFRECQCGGGYGGVPDDDSADIVGAWDLDALPEHLRDAADKAGREFSDVFRTRRHEPLVLLPALVREG